MLGAHKKRNGVEARQPVKSRKGGGLHRRQKKSVWGCIEITRENNKSCLFALGHTKKKVRLKHENKRKEERVRVCAGSTQRKKRGQARKPVKRKKGGGSHRRQTKKVSGAASR